MKLFCTSDIHSFFTPFKKALDEAGFDPNNEEHYLIVCGDCFDRGEESVKLLHYLMSLERKIIIKGNHDILFDDLCMREFPYSHDFSNGTAKAVYDLGGSPSFDEGCRNAWNKTAAYRASLVNYFETKNYIFCHSWIPLAYSNMRKHYDPEWRAAGQSAWDQAMWGNPFELAAQELNQTGKTIIFGHWHTSWPRHHWEGKPEFTEGADFSPYFGEDIIGLDACTAHTGKVNVLVLEDDFLSNK